MDKLLHGKVAIVTGAARGIGRAAALVCAREGAQVIASDLEPSGCAETLALVRAAGGAAEFVHCDIAEEASVQALIERTLELYGRLDCAYNNAGLGHGQSLLTQIELAGWERTMDVVLKGTWLCMKHQIPAMLKSGGGAIVNCSSAAGLLGHAHVAGYGAAKAGVAHLTRTASHEFAAQGIRVNAIAPGPIATEMVAAAIRENPSLERRLYEMVPMGRIGQPQEVAELVVWLLSSRASYICGAVIPIDGGQVA